MTVMGKGNTLEYILRVFPDIPIPPFVRFPKDKKTGWFDQHLLRAAKQVGFPKEIIIRSDYFGEDGIGHSFAGIFDSLKVPSGYNPSPFFRKVRDGYDHESAKLYAEARKVAVPEGPIDVFLQRYVSPGLLGILAEHPCGESYLIDFIKQPDEHRSNLLDPPKFGCIVPKNDPLLKIPYGQDIQEQLLRAIADYERISQSIDKEYTGQMEFSINPYAVFQYRLFKKREEITFKLPDGMKKDKDELWFPVPLAFGSTGPDGLELTLYESSNWKKDPDHAALSHEAISVMAPGLAILEPAPKVFFFMEEALQSHPLQCHSTFRLLERPVPIAFVDSSFIHQRDFDEAKIRYWSDGRRGIIKILEHSIK
ncbi:MAG: hypothetical protein V1743_05600 [Nanoarchaeota archaeon]